MWRPLFGDAPADEVPITHVTNGVHLPSFLSPPIRAPPRPPPRRRVARPRGRPGDVGRRSTRSPTRSSGPRANEARRLLVDYVKAKSVQDRLLRGEDPETVRAVAETFSEDTLTLGFARRIATYKRLFLLTYDPERVRRIFADGPPLQMIVAGKAHPLDDNAKQMLVDVFSLSQSIGITSRVAFLENYDLSVAGADRRRLRRLGQRPAPAARGERDERHEVGGERRAQPERARRLVGRGLRRPQRLGDRRRGEPRARTTRRRTRRHAHALYDLLEQQVIPLFHDRDEHGIPRRWLEMVRASLKTNGPRFSAARMVDGVRRADLSAPLRSRAGFRSSGIPSLGSPPAARQIPEGARFRGRIYPGDARRRSRLARRRQS